MFPFTWTSLYRTSIELGSVPFKAKNRRAGVLKLVVFRETKGVCCDSEQAYEVLRPVSQCGVSSTIVVALPNGERRPLNGHRLSNMVNSWYLSKSFRRLVESVSKVKRKIKEGKKVERPCLKLTTRVMEKYVNRRTNSRIPVNTYVYICVCMCYDI